MNDLFHAAIERDVRDRGAFLAEACAGDAALLQDVERLVAAHQDAGGFIDAPVLLDAIELFADNPERSMVEQQQVGAYRILREIGRGGMGAVYLAERADKQYEKHIAMKLIKRGMDTESVLRRFRTERQILARLDHPNIARLYDGGTTDDGLPYFVMEYIDGQPIHQYCDAHEFTIDQRLDLFRQVCAAVSYAHQNLVVHRDIKPSNILVTAAGIAKLLDFGIARILHDAEDAETSTTTMTGVRIMTPEYASPEQVQGLHATTLSDVYSLGVVLYELLSGQAPYRFKSRSLEDIVAAIGTTEPERPSAVLTRGEEMQHGQPAARLQEQAGTLREGSVDKLRRRLRGDLDNIVLMAMRKDPQRRYGSVEQFSEDIHRHLSGLPVLARPDTFAYRGSKFLRRHRAAVAGATLVLLTLVVGILATAWQAHRAQVHEGLAKSAQARAERRFDDMRKLVRSVLFDYHDAIKDLAGSTPVRERLVRDGLEYLNSLAKEAGGDPSLERELAAAYERVGDVQGGSMFANLGDTAGATESYRKGVEIYQSLLAADPRNRETQLGIASCSMKLGNLLWETGDTEGGLEHNRGALSILQALVAGNPQDSELRLKLVKSHDYVGMILQERGDTRAALEHYSRQLAELGALPPSDRQAEKVRRSFSTAYEHIGTALLEQGEFDAALQSNRKALAIRTVLCADFPLNADYRRTVVVSHYNDGEILARMGRFREALASYRMDLAIAGELSAADPKNEQYRGDRAYALIRVGDMLVRLGDSSQALANYRQSLALRAEDVTADPVNLWKRSSLIEAHAKTSKTLAKAGQRGAALAQCAATLRLMEQTAIDPTNAAFRGFFADTYSDLGEAYSSLASSRGTPAPERREDLRAACGMWRRSSEIWQDMQRRGIQGGADPAKAEAVAREIARCVAALGRMN